jgi:hypothetical protein
VEELFDPLARTVSGRDQVGEEEQDLARYAKDQLVFPSGEPLPVCICHLCRDFVVLN